MPPIIILRFDDLPRILIIHAQSHAAGAHAVGHDWTGPADCEDAISTVIENAAAADLRGTKLAIDSIRQAVADARAHDPPRSPADTQIAFHTLPAPLDHA